MKMQMQHKLSAAERRREKKEKEGERESERVSGVSCLPAARILFGHCQWQLLQRLTACPAASMPCPGRVLAWWLIKMRCHLAKVKNYPAQGAKHATKTRRRKKKNWSNWEHELVDCEIHCQIAKDLDFHRKRHIEIIPFTWSVHEWRYKYNMLLILMEFHKYE